VVVVRVESMMAEEIIIGSLLVLREFIRVEKCCSVCAEGVDVG
jgi:hypothetical protein